MIWPILIPLSRPYVQSELQICSSPSWSLLLTIVGAAKTTRTTMHVPNLAGSAALQRSTALIYFDSKQSAVQRDFLREFAIESTSFALPVFGSTVIQSRTTNRIGSDSEI